MHSRTRAIAALLVLVAASARARSEEPGDRRRLQEIEKKIGEVRETLGDRIAQEKSALAQIEQIDRLAGLLAEQLGILDRQVAEQQAKVEDAERRTAAVQADFDSKKAALKDRLVVLYKMGELSYARLLLSAEDTTDLARAYVYVSKMVEADRTKVEAYRSALRELQSEQEALDQKSAELAQLKTANMSKRAELDQERRRKRQTVEDIRKEKGRYLQLLGELESSAKDLRKMLNELPPTLGQLSPTGFKGSLKWPNPGKVTLGFGLHKHPQFNTITVQNGIDIDASYGDSVTSIFDGKVVFADWFRGYGNLVIIEHGDKFFSLYAHLSRFAVSIGEMVVAGQAIGNVGDSASLKGAYLYFELRQGEKALNPIEWLEKRRNAG